MIINNPDMIYVRSKQEDRSRSPEECKANNPREIEFGKLMQALKDLPNQSAVGFYDPKSGLIELVDYFPNWDICNRAGISRAYYLRLGTVSHRQAVENLVTRGVLEKRRVDAKKYEAGGKKPTEI